MLLRDTGKKFDPAPEGLHHAVAVDVCDLGLQDTPWGPKPKIDIRWELDLINEKTGKRFIVSRWFGATLASKGALRPLLESWRGKPFTREELAGFDPEVLIGVNAQVQIVHVLKDDGDVSARVQAVVGAPKGVPKIHPSKDYVRVKDRPGTPVASEAHAEQDDESVPF
jgi:hypothetical protein